MAYHDTHLRNQLIASSLRINDFDVRDILGLDNDWLTGFHFLTEHFAQQDFASLSQLLKQVQHHNQLVTALEPALQQTGNTHSDKQALTALNQVITTFSQTKAKILKAFQPYTDLHNIPDPEGVETYTTSSPLNSLLSNQTYSELMQASIELAQNVPTQDIQTARPVSVDIMGKN